VGDDGCVSESFYPRFDDELEIQRGVATTLHWIGPVEFGVCLAEEVQHMEA